MGCVRLKRGRSVETKIRFRDLALLHINATQTVEIGWVRLKICRAVEPNIRFRDLDLLHIHATATVDIGCYTGTRHHNDSSCIIQMNTRQLIITEWILMAPKHQVMLACCRSFLSSISSLVHLTHAFDT